MRNDDLKTIQQNVLSYNQNYDIMQWGAQNDYPQQILRVVSNSITAQECLSIYKSFLMGLGFKDTFLNDYVINSKNQTLFEFLEILASDYAIFGGFAFLVKYNAFLDVREVLPIGFETLRLSNRDKNYNYQNLAIHNDWGKEYQRLKRFDDKDIKRFNFFDSSKQRLKAEILHVGDITKYKGQIFYYSNTGRKVYSQPIFTPAIKDMHTEDTISTIDNRNAYNRFMPSGILVQTLNNNGIDEYEAQNINNEFQNAFLQAQGPDSLGKIMALTVRDKDDMPQFINMQPNNYANDYKVTSERIKNSIRQAFRLPPILCSEHVSTGFDTDAMQSAFIYYNSQTNTERQILTKSIRKVFANWYDKRIKDLSFEIKPSSWQNY